MSDASRELLTAKTSSSKKRKVARRPPPPPTRSRDRIHDDLPPTSSPSPDPALPSSEPDDDSVLSFSADSAIPGLEKAPAYVRRGSSSQPASSLPQRFRRHTRHAAAVAALQSTDHVSSGASSPCAAAYADLSLESDRGGDEAGIVPAQQQHRSRSPLRFSRRIAIMNGDAEPPQRSSSPLKRRASSMDPAEEDNTAGAAALSRSPGQESADANDLPRAMSVDAPESVGQDAITSQPPPPLREQVKIIETLLKASADAAPQEGDVSYIVSKTWVKKALALRPSSKPSSTHEGNAAPLGPVDNSDIVLETIKDSSGTPFVRLIPGSGTESFELFPEDAWNLVMDWYGLQAGQEPIIRTAINTADSKQDPPNIMYEFHPPVFRVHRLWSEVSSIPIEQSLKARNPPPLTLARSTTTHAQTFLKEIKSLAGIASDRKVRLFSVPPGVPAAEQKSEPPSALTPPESPGRETHGSETATGGWPTLLVDIKSFALVRDQRQSVTLVDHTTSDKYNGNSGLRHHYLTTDQTLILDEAIDNAYVSNYTGRSKTTDKSMPSRLGVSTGMSSMVSSVTNSNRSSPAPDGPMTHGRAHKKRNGRSLGAVGLHNLGNTCYMNSALQCVRSVEELTKYFLTESYIDEINKTNVLGYDGRLASAYGNLLREIYEEGRGSVSPRDFKLTVGRCRPTFSGYGQQDSQEFLGFLLDALQEDLSRIKKKPYIEKPDSTDDMINDPAAIKAMADKVWDITCRRDDSVIADLFTGMYKSTLKCPECGKISITFDPFNNLTLPLPLESVWARSVKFFPLNDNPVKLDVELPKHSSVEVLKQFISARTGVPTERLMGAEEFKDRFWKMYDNHEDISEVIQLSECPAIHELEAVPTNWPSKRPKQRYRSMLDIGTLPENVEYDEEEGQTLVVPVVHRRPNYSGRAPEGIAPPHFITLTREEASDFETIRRKILQRVATFSTWSKLKDSFEPNGADTADIDMVVTTASDADSSADGKIVSQSVEGEDDMVDIAMNDAGAGVGSQPTSTEDPGILRHFNVTPPKYADPSTFLAPELQNLFELCYFRSDSDGPVPTGWGPSTEQSNPLPKISDRIPETETKPDDASPDSSNSGASGNEESSNEEGATPESSQTRMNDESSEEEEEEVEPAPAVKFNGRQGRQNNKFTGGGGRKKFKGQRTYGKKGNKRRDKQMRANKLAQKSGAVAPQPTPPAVADGGPLIRLFEGVVVDWNEDAWETVFGNNSRRPDPEHGSRTFTELQTLPDPALRIKQRKRASRRTRGLMLEECLDKFEQAEVLSQQDMWYCPRCKEHRRASKKFDLWKTPDILVVHLNRFSSSGWRRDKLDVHVEFPIEGLDLTSRVIAKEDGKEEVYDLIGVDDHFGGLGGGHYTAYAKNFVDKRWYSYNDSSVHVVSDPSSVVTSAAYLLFYRRRSSGHLGGQHFDAVFAKYDSEGMQSDNEATESGDEGNNLGGQKLGNGLKVKSLGNLEQSNSPDYRGTAIRHSIEDDGMDMSVKDQKSLDMTQGWSFTALGAKNGNETNDVEGSDHAQFDSSADERRRAGSELDTDMASVDHFDENTTAWEDADAVLSVPAANGVEEGNSSDDVTEIHIEADKTSRSE